MTRITNADAIERRLLDLAYTTNAKLTATALAYYAPCSIDDATRVLDDLAARDRLEMTIEDDGTVVYELRGRQQIAAPTAPPTQALVPVERSSSPLLAAILTAFIPGAGHVYTGRIAAAVIWFVAVGLAYGLILPGVILHVCAILSAARSARMLDAGYRRPPPRLLFVPPHQAPPTSP
jgi:TM2 domain-containing membrane protein YozV